MLIIATKKNNVKYFSFFFKKSKYLGVLLAFLLFPILHILLKKVQSNGKVNLFTFPSADKSKERLYTPLLSCHP